MKPWNMALDERWEIHEEGGKCLFYVYPKDARKEDFEKLQEIVAEYFSRKAVAQEPQP